MAEKLLRRLGFERARLEAVPFQTFCAHIAKLHLVLFAGCTSYTIFLTPGEHEVAWLR
jgi:hypothetical protein